MLAQGMHTLYEGLVARLGVSMELFAQVVSCSVFNVPEQALRFVSSRG